MMITSDHQNVRLVLIIARVRSIFDDASSLVLGEVRLQSHRSSIIVQAVASVQRLHKVREFVTGNVDRLTIIVIVFFALSNAFAKADNKCQL